MMPTNSSLYSCHCGGSIDRPARGRLPRYRWSVYWYYPWRSTTMGEFYSLCCSSQSQLYLTAIGTLWVCYLDWIICCRTYGQGVHNCGWWRSLRFATNEQRPYTFLTGFSCSQRKYHSKLPQSNILFRIGSGASSGSELQFNRFCLPTRQGNALHYELYHAIGTFGLRDHNLVQIPNTSASPNRQGDVLRQSWVDGSWTGQQWDFKDQKRGSSSHGSNSWLARGK